jgi:hypothetical protein
MTPLRKTALVAGLLYLLTFVSIPTLALYGSVHDPNYILGPGPDIAVLFGGVLEVIVAFAGIGTAVALYPVLKRPERRGRAGPCRLASPGSRRHPRWRRVSPDDRELAADRSGDRSFGHRPDAGDPV